MKRLLISIMAFALISVGAYAQNDSFKKIFNEFENIKGVESVSISPKVFAFFMDDDDEEAALFKKMDSMKVISAEGTVGKTLHKRLLSFIEKEKFEEVMKVKDGGGNEGEEVYMYSKPTELIFLALSDDECAVIYISGSIDKDIIKAMSEGKMNITAN